MSCVKKIYIVLKYNSEGLTHQCQSLVADGLTDPLLRQAHYQCRQQVRSINPNITDEFNLPKRRVA